MCTILKSLDYKVAEEDIVCWKLAKDMRRYNGKLRYVLVSLFQQQPIEFGKKLVIPDFLETVETKSGGFLVTKHAFHLFLDRKEAEKLLDDANGCAVLVKCIIPKGAKYAKGKFIYKVGFLNPPKTLKSAVASEIIYVEDMSKASAMW